MSWHKCFLCGCQEHEERKEQPQGGASQDARKQD